MTYNKVFCEEAYQLMYQLQGTVAQDLANSAQATALKAESPIALMEIFRKLGQDMSDRAKWYQQVSQSLTQHLEEEVKRLDQLSKEIIESSPEAALLQKANDLLPYITDRDVQGFYQVMFQKPLLAPEILQKRAEAELNKDTQKISQIDEEILTAYRTLDGLREEWKNLPFVIRGYWYPEIDSSRFPGTPRTLAVMLKVIEAYRRAENTHRYRAFDFARTKYLIEDGTSYSLSVNEEADRCLRSNGIDELH